MLQAGFLLSFVAVALLMASGPVQDVAPRAATRWQAVRHTLREGLRTQLIATVGLTPLTLIFFAQISVVGFVANLVAIPLVTLLITVLALLGVILPPLWQVGAWLV